MRRIDEYDYFAMCQKMSTAIHGSRHIHLDEWRKICDGVLAQIVYLHDNGIIDASEIIGEK
ncbi:unnamed protein product [marine sediment metagenome]|uniref:Uncharacterized protein n=1 Tax=marine sediment metagenome TaxID=412755 RepID=X1B8Y6_9ZZZZ